MPGLRPDVQISKRFSENEKRPGAESGRFSWAKGDEMRIAVFADIHLGDSKRTPQRAALAWAVREIERCGADAAAVAGDLTACGSMYAAMRAKKLLRGVKVPLLTVPGNSDLRTPETAPVMERLWLTPEEGICVGGVRVLGVDTARGTIDERERARMEAIDASLPLILVSHQADTHVDADSRAYLADFLRRRNVLAWFTGHVHARVDTVFAGTRCLAPRALDPDKCGGGLPELLVLDTETGALESRVFDESLPCRWPWEKREALIESLGISLYSLKEDLAFCVENRVPHMEMRGVTEADAETRALLAAWRKNGGWTLSQHLTKLGWDAEKGCVSGVEKFRAVVRTALECGADMATVHPPEETVETMGVGSPAFSALADAMAEEMRPLARAGVRIVVEKLSERVGSASSNSTSVRASKPSRSPSAPYSAASTARAGRASSARSSAATKNLRTPTLPSTAPPSARPPAPAAAPRKAPAPYRRAPRCARAPVPPRRGRTRSRSA